SARLPAPRRLPRHRRARPPAARAAPQARRRRHRDHGHPAAGAAAVMTFADVVRALDSEPDVVVGKGFHNDVLKREGKIFAMDYAGTMVFKLPRDRCAALRGAGEGVAFARGQGKPLKEWVVVDDPNAW